METSLVVTTGGKELVASQDMLQLVTFTLGDEEYCVDVLMVREIIRIPDITRVPNTQFYVEGVINLRGKVIPVIALRKRFGLDEMEYDGRTRIIVMEIDGDLIGFLVDAVSEVIRVFPDEIQPPPAVAASGDQQECMSGVIQRDERLIIVLDLGKIATPDAFVA